MTSNPRRTFLRGAAGAALAAGPGAGAIAKALAIPANGTTRTIRDVQHVVVLMQENRAFDHYFGSLRGVRGFGDPRPVTLASGRPVWFQPAPKIADGYALPFRLDAAATRAQAMNSLDHSWKGDHARWKRHDAWVAEKSAMTMGYFTRADLPFYYALADAFTVCDAYHCSLFGPTNPNRQFLFTGTNGLTAGETGLLAVTNPWTELNETADMAHDNPAFAGFGWTSYAERLQAAGVSWKVYQEYDNYGDNALAYFSAFRGIKPDSALYLRGRDWAPGSTPANAKTSRGEHLVADFAKDVAAGTLPQVSWIVAPYAMSEHPSASPGYGQSLTARLIGALTDRPEVWAKTVFILNYDENDGFFDHVPPPVPGIGADVGRSTVDVAGEVYKDQPVGLGPRVPMIAVSPWSSGGWVNSEVFDHTSVIRFLEARFGVVEPNISPWRRAVCGDLTSVFDFRGAASRKPARLPDVSTLIAAADVAALGPKAVLPERQALPAQEPGVRPARALPYRLQVHAAVSDSALAVTFVNTGAVGAVFGVWSAMAGEGPWFHTVGAGARLTVDHPVGAGGYDLTVHGPNGFLRRFAGAAWTPGPVIEAADDPVKGAIVLTLRNDAEARRVTVSPGVYRHGPPRVYDLAPQQTVTDAWPLDRTALWYDLILADPSQPLWRRRLSGHLETGRPGFTDPAIGA